MLQLIMLNIAVGFLNEFVEKLSAEWALRVGLAATYIYSGFSIITAPDNWIGYLPGWFTNLVNVLMPVSVYMRIQGAGELIMALILLFWFSPRWLLLIVALLSALEFAGILALSGIDIVTFHDIGLFGAAAALVLLITKKEHSAEI